MMSAHLRRANGLDGFGALGHMRTMSGIEGVGEAVTGGAQVSRAPHGSALSGGQGNLHTVARAVEPQAGESVREGVHACFNCGAELDGPYCRQCGQKAHVHRSVGAILHDIAHSVLHLDGKFWRTLPLLAWRPGELTRRYAHGERAKFVSPMAMFLFSVFLMFAVLSIYGLSLSNLESQPALMRQGLDTARTESLRQFVQARERRRALARGEVVRGEDDRPQSAAELDQAIANAREQVLAIDRVRAGNLGTGVRFDTGWDRLDKGLNKFNENPGLALYKLQANGYKFSWLLIPLSVPFVWLLFFWTRRFHFYDHTVFVTYSLSFMTLLAVVLMILGFAGVWGSVIAMAAIAIPPVHMFRQLKQAYGLGWFGAVVRTFLLVNFCAITAGLFFTLLLGIGALG